MNRLGYLLLLLTVTAIAATSSWLLSKVDEKPLSILQPERHDPDYFMTNFNATVMNAGGTPKYKMSATRLEHFPDDGSIDVTQPYFEYFRPHLSPWIVVADAGQIFNKGKLVHLNGKVIMERQKSNTEPYVKLVTRDLRIHTDTEYAETDAKVNVQSDNRQLQATGMRVNLAAGKLELRNKVTGTYGIK